MAYNANGLRTIGAMGTPDGTAGSNRALHTYITNDDAAAVGTGGYFNAEVKRFKVGDIIMVSLDIDGTPALRVYIVSANNGAVVTIALQTVS